MYDAALTYLVAVHTSGFISVKHTPLQVAAASPKLSCSTPHIRESKYHEYSLKRRARDSITLFQVITYAMDPLSITTGVVTLIGATATIINYLERIRTFGKSHEVLLALINSVFLPGSEYRESIDTSQMNDLQAMLIVTRESIQALQTSNLPDVIKAYESLPVFLDKTQTHVDELLDFIKSKILKESGKISFRAWNKETKSKLAEFRGIIAESHQRLHTVIASANL
jgi:hypothetical protein